MSVLLQKEIEGLKKTILTLGAIVEERVHIAVQAILDRDESLAAQVIEGDLEIDQMEVDLEEECLKILALHNPVAVDLRFIIAILKINNDLERIGDLAVNVSERARVVISQEKIDIPFDFPTMSDKVKAMLKQSLDSLVNMDSALATKVCEMDDEVDVINRDMYRQVQEGIRRLPEKMPLLIHLLSISRHLERIADLATNIAQDVIYMIEGRIVRHQAEDYNKIVSKK
jgi:phosphate transport system protein